ncbi:MAG: enoyl-CoA hydratase/isomerase family protein [Mesorhizobium sp.]|nr:enoyl-CoA hydratase/isomerase family protein [Mesorhizobium sp.]MCO5163693.1 enoyl-CoA hydratase/isomerase family protein [Mesorhizobium sp.]
MSHFRIDIDGGVARLTLTRPEKHNAFDDVLIAALTSALVDLERDERVRLLVLAAEGPSFSAGAELGWMKRAGAAQEAENLADARKLAELMRTLDAFSKPTVAAVQGPAYGGGVGLVACCDVAIAATTARFSLSEVRLGLIPSAIGPYVVRAIGPRQARRWFQTAEAFDAETARAIGLVHETVEPEALDRRAGETVAALLKGAPGACREAKRLVGDIASSPIDAAMIEMTAVRIARIRTGDEAKEGLEAFLARRPADWTLGGAR